MTPFFKNIFFVAALSLVLIFATSCKKQPGQGGVASISGKVFADIIFNNKNGDTLGVQQLMPGINVYLCYGTDTVPSDNTKTSYNGEFQFNYLQKGKYTVYVLSDNMSTAASYHVANFKPTSALLVPLEITERKQAVDAGTIHINYAY